MKISVFMFLYGGGGLIPKIGPFFLAEIQAT
jgi:hypothetical protein